MSSMSAHLLPWSVTFMGESFLLFHRIFSESSSRQFYDLIEIFRIGGYAPHTNYLFLGSFSTLRNGAIAERLTRRLRRSRVVQCGNDFPVDLSQTAVS